jgi:hypothetical protein
MYLLVLAEMCISWYWLKQVLAGIGRNMYQLVLAETVISWYWPKHVSAGVGRNIYQLCWPKHVPAGIGRNMYHPVCCKTVTLIKVCAFVGSNCDN